MRRGYHHGNLKEVLIATALELIGAKGPGGFTFAEAARSAGVSPAAPRGTRHRAGSLARLFALGPVYETKLKIMKWAPQGLEQVGLWKKRIAPLPLVAIAGINLARADGVLDAGADSCAVVTDFITAPDPEQRVREWLFWAKGKRRGV